MFKNDNNVILFSTLNSDALTSTFSVCNDNTIPKFVTQNNAINKKKSENIVEKSDKMPWYDGMSILEVLDERIVIDSMDGVVDVLEIF